MHGANMAGISNSSFSSLMCHRLTVDFLCMSSGKYVKSLLSKINITLITATTLVTGRLAVFGAPSLALYYRSPHLSSCSLISLAMSTIVSHGNLLIEKLGMVLTRNVSQQSRLHFLPCLMNSECRMKKESSCMVVFSLSSDSMSTQT